MEYYAFIEKYGSFQCKIGLYGGNRDMEHLFPTSIEHYIFRGLGNY